MPQATIFHTTVTASALTVHGQEPPAEIVYIPDGKNVLTPSVNGEAKTITVELNATNGDAIAARFQSALQARLASNVRPFVDFDHEGKTAAAIPKEFRYQAGQGLILALDWTEAGTSAVKGRNYSYFSPSFLLGDDSTPHSIVASGAIGSLVNDPAFRTIPRIAASNNQPSPQPTQPNTMTPEEITAMKAENTDLKAKLKALEEADAKRQADAKAKAECAAQKIVAEAVQDGRIDAADTAKQKEFTDAIAQGNAYALQCLNSMPKKHQGIEQPIVNAAQATPANAESLEARMSKAEAAARQELGATAGYAQIFARAQQIDPTAFQN